MHCLKKFSSWRQRLAPLIATPFCLWVALGPGYILYTYIQQVQCEHKHRVHSKLYMQEVHSRQERAEVTLELCQRCSKSLSQPTRGFVDKVCPSLVVPFKICRQISQKARQIVHYITTIEMLHVKTGQIGMEMEWALHIIKKIERQ